MSQENPEGKNESSNVGVQQIQDVKDKQAQEILELLENNQLASAFSYGKIFLKYATDPVSETITRESGGYSIYDTMMALYKKSPDAFGETFVEVSQKARTETFENMQRKELLTRNIDENKDFLVKQTDYKSMISLLYWYGYNQSAHISPETLYDKIFEGDLSSLSQFFTEKVQSLSHEKKNYEQGFSELEDIIKIISRLMIKLPTTTENRKEIENTLLTITNELDQLDYQGISEEVRGSLLYEYTKILKNFSHLSAYDPHMTKKGVQEEVKSKEKGLQGYTQSFQEKIQGEREYPNKERELNALKGTQEYHSALIILEKYRYFRENDIQLDDDSRTEERVAFEVLGRYYSEHFPEEEQGVFRAQDIIVDFTEKLGGGKNVFPLIGMIFDVLRYIHVDGGVMFDLIKTLGEQGSKEKAFDYIYIERAIRNIMQETSDEKIQLEQGAQNATIDALTQIPNRFAYNAASKKIEARITRSERNVTPENPGEQQYLGVIDIDKFKIFNDTYGHAIGDIVLTHVAQVLKKSLRDEDEIFRYGGEEFCIFMSCADIQGAQTVIEKLVKEIENSTLEHEGKIYKVTISIGGVHIGVGEKVDEKFKDADAALYQAKEAGRNRGIIDKS